LALIDYEGFRLTVMTHLPLTDSSLVYGSDNGGKTVLCDLEVHKNMIKIAERLHLRPHSVSDYEMALCGDIEIHQFQPTAGKEKQKQTILFVLDMARVFPPAATLFESTPGSIFFRMLRPEFVKLKLTKNYYYHHTLSSDALSNWQKSDPQQQEMDDHVLQATQKLLECVTSFAKHLTDNNETVNAKYIKTALEIAKDPVFNMPYQDSIIRDLHTKGINIRYIGMIVLKLHEMNPVKNSNMITFLVSLMMARALKNWWRKEIRDKKGQRIYEVCLKQSEMFLNYALLLNEIREEKKRRKTRRKKSRKTRRKKRRKQRSKRRRKQRSKRRRKKRRRRKRRKKRRKTRRKQSRKKRRKQRRK